MSKKILVTGANGQLGRAIQASIASSSDLYAFTDIEELDITDPKATLEHIKRGEYDVVVNCAAYTNVEEAEEQTALADRINRQAVENLARASLESSATLIHISTDYVFDGKAHTPYREDAATAPIGIYGKTKLAGERLLEASGCKHIIIRTSWLYSQWGANFVLRMLKLTAQRDSLKVIFDQVGTPTYAMDLAKAIVEIVSHDQLDKVGLYHYSNEGLCSWYDFALQICSDSGNSCTIEPIRSEEYPSKVERPHYSVLDKTKFKESFGIEIPHWKSSLQKLIELM